MATKIKPSALSIAMPYIGNAVALNSATASNGANKTAITTKVNNLKALGINTAKGYSLSVVITDNGAEYFGTLNIGTGTLLSGIVTDINESKHYPCNVNTSTGEVTFSAENYFLEKTSNEVQEMLDAIQYSYTHVPFTDTFKGCTSLTNLHLETEIVADLDLSDCTRLTQASLVGVIAKLVSGQAKTLTLGETNLAKLTDEQKAVATAKGWTLA